MKKVILIILTIALIYLTINQLFVNEYDGPIFSGSRIKSIENGYFLFDYSPDKDSVQLHNRKIKSPDLWSEKGQLLAHSFIFFPRCEVDPRRYNIIANSMRECSSNEYILDLEMDHMALNCIDGLGSVVSVFSIPETIKLRIKQADANLGWKKETVTDSLIYVRI